jgi:hypothetical protein
MRARTSLRTIGGVLLVAVLVVQPAAAAPRAEPDRAGRAETLEAWWGGLVEWLVAAISGGSETDGGPSIDPAGASASGEEESDSGPDIDPAGASAAGEEETDGGPGMDPAG